MGILDCEEVSRYIVQRVVCAYVLMTVLGAKCVVRGGCVHRSKQVVYRLLKYSLCLTD